MSKAKKSGVDPKLVRYVSDLMAEVMKEPEEGKESKYSLTDKMKVMDRFIKVEQIRLDVHEDDSGAFFKQRGGQSSADE